MRQTLFTIPHELFGLPLFGFGWLMILWALFSIGLMIWLIRKQGYNADTAGYVPLLLIAGAVIVFLAPMMEVRGIDGKPLGLPIRGYGVMLMLGTVTGVGMSLYRARRVGIDVEMIFSLTFWMFVCGIAGARALFVILYWSDFQRDTMMETIGAVFSVTEGGLVVYGSLICGFAAAVVFLWRRGLSLRQTFAIGDVLAPGMMAGLALGRIGCLLNGCCFGGVCQIDAAPKLEFPKDSPPYIHQRRLGQLHGFRIAVDENGRAVIAQVDEGSPVQVAGLKAGAKIEAIELPPVESFRAALFSEEFAGKKLILVTSDDKKIELKIPSWSAKDQDIVKRIGLRLKYNLSNIAVVSQIEPGGQADKAGLRKGDQIHSVQLPRPQSFQAVKDLLDYAGLQIVLVPADGEPIGWSILEMPQASRPVHPTQIYSAVNAGLMCLFLWFYFPFRRRDGEVIALLLMLYPIARTLLEIIRNDEPGRFGTSITISQWVSAFILLTGAALWVGVSRRPPGSVLDEPSDSQSAKSGPATSSPAGGAG